MVSNTVLEVVLRAKDEVSNKLKEINGKLRETGNAGKTAMDMTKNASQQASNALNQQKTTIDSLKNQYNSLKSSVTNAFGQIKNILKNPTSISASSISKPFMNAAEQIKQKYSSMVEIIKGKLKQVGGSQIITIKGENGDVIKKIEVTREELLKIKQMNVDPFKNISTAGLKVLNGELGQATIQASKFNGTAIQVGSSVKTVTTTMGSLGQIGSAVGFRINTAFTSLKSKIGSLRGSFGGITANVSMLQGTLMRAFGIVGVTSISQFTIGAAIARQKINAVTQSVVGSEAKMKSLNKVISDATKGGVVGFNKVATAVNTIGIKHNLTYEQLSKTPPLLNKIGTLATAMGKDGDAAAQLMSNAFMGLSGNVRALKQLGITKDDLIGAGWSGAASDVDGYINALNKVIDKKPEMKEYLNSFEGQMARVKMAIAGVGRSIGEMILPFLNAFLDAFLSLHSACPAVTTAIIVGALAFIGLASAAMVLLPLIEILNLEINEVAVSQHILNMVSLENPYLWIAIAVIALVAVLVYLYQTNEDVRKSIDNIISIVRGGLIAAWNGLVAVAQVVWQAIVRIAQILYTGLIPAWESLQKIFAPLIPAFQRLGQLLGELWNAFGQGTDSGNAMNVFVEVLGQNLTHVIQVIVGLVEVLLAVLIPAITFVINVLSAWVRFITRIANAFNDLMKGNISLGEFLDKFADAFGSLSLEILGAIGQLVIDILSGLGAILEPLLGGIAEWFAGLGPWLYEQLSLLAAGVMSWIIENSANFLVFLGEQFNNMILAFINFFVNLGLSVYNGMLNVVTGFINYVVSMYNGFVTWLSNIIAYAYSWGMNITNNIRTTAYNIVMGFISFICTLPGKFQTYLNLIINKIIGFASTGYNNMKNSAIQIYNGFKEKIQQLPQVMWDELMHIKDKINQSVGQLLAAIGGLATRMVDWFKEKLGIKSPGFMSKTIEAEMGYIGDKMENARSTLEEKTGEVADSILTGFNSVDLSAMSDTVADAIPSSVTGSTAVSQQITASTSNYATIGNNSLDPGEELLSDEITPLMTLNSEAITQSISDMATNVTPQLQMVTSQLSNMGLASTQATQLTTLNNQQIINSYLNLNQQVVASMQNLINTNNSGWLRIKSITIQNLNSILTSTKSVTSQMVEAWNSMKNSIISAANQIQTEAQARFNSLWSHIKTFYHNIQHPGGAGSPSGSGAGGRSTNMTGIVRRAVSNGILSSMYPASVLRKKTVSYNNLKNDYSFSNSDIEYLLTGNSTNSRVDNFDIIRYLIGEGGNAGGWDSIVKPNLDFIRNKSNEWKIAGPVILGKYPTQSRFKVGQFENGTPNIDFDTFRGIAEDVFSQCHYEFYYDSERYGNWITAAYHGGMNCSDSTDFLLALASACGLPGTKVHGHWNQYGHYWANIAGHKMDTTGWMQRRTWTPSASHAGAPPKDADESEENVPIIVELLLYIVRLLEERNKKDLKVDLNNSGTVSMEVKHELTGDIPSGLNEAEIVSIMNNNAESTAFIKKLTGNREFQNLDNRMKAKLVREVERFS